MNIFKITFVHRCLATFTVQHCFYIYILYIYLCISIYFSVLLLVLKEICSSYEMVLEVLEVLEVQLHIVLSFVDH